MALVLWAGPALADGSEPAAPSSCPSVRCTIWPEVVSPTSALTSLLHAWSGASPGLELRLLGRPLSRLGFFAQGRGFSIPRAGTLFDLEGGASIQLGQGMSLIGSYRMLGHDFDVGAAAVGPQQQGPFVGMLFGF